jgi:glycosyltransferase involved in cell wall biosynthesis
MNLRHVVAELTDRSSVIYPGLDFKGLRCNFSRGTAAAPVVVWSHRWEHDKNPQLFFDSLYELDREGVDFRLIVLGQSFDSRPVCFDVAERRLAHRIDHFGYVESRQQYLKLLNQGDIVVSTALHEFFGISVIEAVRAGCRPLLPDDLAYPELFDKTYLYKRGELKTALRQLLEEPKRLSTKEAASLTDRFGWPQLASSYERLLFSQKRQK